MLNLLTHFYSLRDFQHQTQHFAADRDEQVLKASKALETIQAARLSRAHVADCQSRLEEVMAGLARLRKENDKSEQSTPLSVAASHLISFGN